MSHDQAERGVILGVREAMEQIWESSDQGTKRRFDEEAASTCYH
jgi:frataxin-like iron-binding protein CyaY